MENHMENHMEKALKVCIAEVFHWLLTIQVSQTAMASMKLLIVAICLGAVAAFPQYLNDDSMLDSELDAHYDEALIAASSESQDEGLFKTFANKFTTSVKKHLKKLSPKKRVAVVGNPHRDKKDVNKIPCPVIATLYNQGFLNPNRDGRVTRTQLQVNLPLPHPHSHPTPPRYTHTHPFSFHITTTSPLPGRHFKNGWQHSSYGCFE